MSISLEQLKSKMSSSSLGLRKNSGKAVKNNSSGHNNKIADLMAAEKGSSNFQQQALMLMADEVDKKKMINDEAQKLKEAFRLAVSKRVES